MSLKTKLWIISFPITLFFTGAFFLHELGVAGSLDSSLFRHSLFQKQLLPGLRRWSSSLTDIKFRIRGPRKPQKPIVIVEIDSAALEKLGRWPWRRDDIAWLIEKCFQLGAASVGLDILFPEPEVRVPEELALALKKRGLTELSRNVETDPVLEKVIRKHADRLVMGWVSESACQPLYQTDCPVIRKGDAEALPPDFDRFAISQPSPSSFDPAKSPLVSAPNLDPNIPEFVAATKHQGFVNGFRDPDGGIRRTALMMLVADRVHPSLALALAQRQSKQALHTELDASSRVRRLFFEGAGSDLAVTATGAAGINYRGPERTFDYVGALQVLEWGEDVDNVRTVASTGVEKLKGAAVLIGVTALGLHDLVATPFDSRMPGVEIHATVVDNVLSGDLIRSSNSGSSMLALGSVMGIVGIGFGYAAVMLNAVWGLVVFAALMLVTWATDFLVLFNQNQDWNTVFLYLEIFFILIFVLCARYIIEERDKKFLRSAFSKYVSPAVVDLIVKDNTKLSVWGKRKEITILFCDIRGFTHSAERMDARALGEFLNDYFGVMTDIVFKLGGTLDKYIGDALMAFWGAPIDEPRHAALACRAASAMLEALEANRARLEGKFGGRLDIGIGLNSGLVTVGNMGSPKNFSYTAVGDGVNLASRIETATKYYRVPALCSDVTLHFIANSGETPPLSRELDLAKLRGKDHPVVIHQLLREGISLEGLEVFRRARNLYKARDWREASRQFQEAAIALGQPGALDHPSHLLALRCEGFLKEPPPSDWDGAWTLEE